MSQSITLAIRKIIILNDKHPDTMEATVTLAPHSTVADLRDSLCSQDIMSPVDAFMLPSEPEFALAKVDEEYKSWKAVQGNKHVVTILTEERGLQDPTSELGALRGIPEFFKKAIQKKEPDEQPLEGVSLQSENPSPAAAVTATTNVLNASKLSEEQWKHLVTKQTQIMHGIVLGSGRASDDQGPKWAPRALIQYKSKSVTRSVSDGTSKDDLAFTSERNHKYAQKGWVKGTVEVTSPYASASIEAERSEEFGRSIANKTIHITNTYIIQRAKVQFARQFIELTPEFKAELNTSLAEETDQGKQRALTNLFESYGHVFPLDVVLGGTFIQSAQGQVESDEDIKATKNELRLSLDAHVGGAGVGGGKSEQRKDTSKKDTFHRLIHVLGGDSTIQDPKIWIESVKDNGNWRVVRVERVIPIVELLTEAEQVVIARVAPPRFKALRGKWVDSKTEDLPDGICKNLQVGIPKITDKEWFWLGQSFEERMLIVKEEIPGALCPIERINPVWNSKGKWPWWGTVNYLGNPSPEKNGSFEALGSCVYGQSRLAPGNPQPELEKGPWSKLRAVRTELLVKGKCEDHEKWHDNGKHGPNQASIWLIKPRENTVDLGLFKAFAGHDSKSVGVWKLRADEIEIDPEE